jgi:ferritin-like protein
MGTRQTDTTSQTVTRLTKPPKCSICRQVIKDTCDWHQGRCPHVPSLAQSILNNPYKARFYNLIKFFKGRK